MTIAPADRPFVEIGFIEVRSGPLDQASQESLLQELTKKGGEMGCEAVVVFAIEIRNGAVPEDAGYRGSCLMFKDPAHALSEAPGQQGAFGDAVSPRCRAHKMAIRRAKSPKERLEATKATPPECH